MVASVLFYMRDGGAFTWVILVAIGINGAAALGIDRLRGSRAAARLLAATVTLNLVSLATFKYGGFLTDNLNVVLGGAGVGALPQPDLLLPIGISFFTFHSISYLVDVHRQQAAAQKGAIGTALYLLFFPQLIAGPIIRYHEIAAQIAARPHDLDGFTLGVRRFIVGLAKKLLIAGIVARPADAVFAMPPAELSAAHAWLGVVCYTLQIYFDFSGYSDMAIGLGHMFGFTFPENFRYPYIARSVQEFWKRWHMTLSAWFRDYLYIPLGGNRRRPARVYLNLTLVFFLCGLWHGASWTFVVWGLLHGLFLVIERMGLGAWLERQPRAVGHTYTLLIVMVTWVFFRAETLAGAGAVLAAMAGLGTAAATPFAPSWYLTPELLAVLVAGIIGSTPIVPVLQQRLAHAGGGDGEPVLRQPWAIAAAVLLVALLGTSLTQVALGAFTPFIYFRF
ncbi:MAG: MBOAT family O-acyltransferase [Vicinamibacterales bacterium]